MNQTDPLVPIPNAELAPLTAWLAEALNIQGFNVIPDWRETTTWAGQASDIIIYTIYRSRTDRVGQWLCDHGIRWTHTRREKFITACGCDLLELFTRETAFTQETLPLFAMENTP